MLTHSKYTSIEELYLDNHKLVFVFLREYIKDDVLREDLASIIWIRIFEQSELFLQMEAGRVKNCIRLMAHNVASDYFEERHRENESTRDSLIVLNVEEARNPVEEQVFSSDIEKYLQEACEVLKQDEKELIRMRFTYQMSAKNVGKILELSEGAVRIKQLRILRKLKREILRLKAEEEK